MKIYELNQPISTKYQIVRVCLDFLNRSGGSSIANGKHILEEDGVFVNVTEYMTRLPEEGGWEAHTKYADLQLVLEGEEYVYVSDIHQMETGPLNEAGDYMTVLGEAKSRVYLNPESAILLMPEDAHMPNMCVGETPRFVKKAVFKIPVSYFGR